MNPAPYRPLQTITVAVIVIGLIGLALSGYLTPVLRLTLDPLVTAQTWVAERFISVQRFLLAPRDLASLRQRNEELEAEVARLQGQVVQLRQQIQDIEILAALVDFARANPQSSYMAATVIGRDPSPFLHYVLINRGSDDGLRRGMPVVTAQGLVGRIAAVTASAARVQLITDAQGVVNVKLQPADAEGILSGSLTGDLFLEQIPQEVDVQTGDLVLTSGLGGQYPANVLIGQVTGVRSLATDIFQRASIQPAVDFSELDILLIIVSFRPINTAPLVP